MTGRKVLKRWGQFVQRLAVHYHRFEDDERYCTVGPECSSVREFSKNKAPWFTLGGYRAGSLRFGTRRVLALNLAEE